MPEPPSSSNNETPLQQELRRLCWLPSSLAEASQIGPGVIWRLVKGKARNPLPETRRKVLIALRQRAEEIGVAPPNEIVLFPASGTPVLSQNEWQHLFVEDTRQMALTTRLNNEHEPQDIFAETRKMLLIALRQRAEARGEPPPHEISQFPERCQPRTYREQWHQTLIHYARQINWAQRLAHELEPLFLLRLRFEVAQRALELAPPRTVEQWENAADLLYYAVQRTAQGEQEALVEATTILNQARLPWKQAVVSALAKYRVLSKHTRKESDHVWQAIVCSLQMCQEEPDARESTTPCEAHEDRHHG